MFKKGDVVEWLDSLDDKGEPTFCEVVKQYASTHTLSAHAKVKVLGLPSKSFWLNIEIHELQLVSKEKACLLRLKGLI